MMDRERPCRAADTRCLELYFGNTPHLVRLASQILRDLAALIALGDFGLIRHKSILRCKTRRARILNNKSIQNGSSKP